MKADRNKLAYIGAKPRRASEPARDSDAWFTPTAYIEKAARVMGGIDLDPFSCASANDRSGKNGKKAVMRYFDAGSDALQQPWFDESQGRVFMNPPYGRRLINAAIERFLANWANQSITQGVVLVNNATETRWFQSLLQAASMVCFPQRRIAFENHDGKHISGNTRGQAFFYFGDRRQHFAKEFGAIGVVLRCATFERRHRCGGKSPEGFERE